MTKKRDQFLDIPIEDMDVLEVCSELGITTEDIIERFKERVAAYERSLDEGPEWDDGFGYTEYYNEEEEEETDG